MSGDDRLSAALAAEHAAIFGYGVLGPKLDGALVDAARQAEIVHRNRRDVLMVRLTDKGRTPPPAEVSYDLPFAVTDRAAALRLAVTLEEGCGAIWRLALPETAGEERKLALDALVDTAVRATRWRRAAGTNPPTVAMPGVPN